MSVALGGRGRTITNLRRPSSLMEGAGAVHAVVVFFDPLRQAKSGWRRARDHNWTDY